MDNIFVERLWRSLKYEEVYLNAYATVAEAQRPPSEDRRLLSKGRRFSFSAASKRERPHIRNAEKLVFVEYSRKCADFRALSASGPIYGLATKRRKILKSLQCNLRAIRHGRACCWRQLRFL